MLINKISFNVEALHDKYFVYVFSTISIIKLFSLHNSSLELTSINSNHKWETKAQKSLNNLTDGARILTRISDSKNNDPFNIDYSSLL